MKTKKYRTDFLFSTPSFTIGMGTVFNLAGNFFNYNTSNSELDADSKALESDWGVIGQDIEDSFELCKEEDKNQLDINF